MDNSQLYARHRQHALHQCLAIDKKITVVTPTQEFKALTKLVNYLVDDPKGLNIL